MRESTRRLPPYSTRPGDLSAGPRCAHIRINTPQLSWNLPGGYIMNEPKDTEAVLSADENRSGMSRRSFFKQATVAGATSAIALGGFVSLASAQDKDNNRNDHDNNYLKKRDTDILVAAQIAEA